MRGLSVTDTTLVIQSPVWLALIFIVVGVLLTGAVFIRSLPRAWRLGALLGTMSLLYGGWYMLGNTTTFESRGFYVEGMFGEEERVGWLQVTGIDTGPKNAEPQQIAFQLRNSSEVTVDLGGLAAQDKARVVDFVRARLKR